MAKEEIMPKENQRQTEPSAGSQSGEEKRLAPPNGTVQAVVVPPSSPFSLTSPFGLMRRFIEDIDQLFDQDGDSKAFAWSPAVEAFRRNGEVVVRADVPGLDEDDIEIEVRDGQLVISGERQRIEEEQGAGFVRSERSYGSFRRFVPLPEGAKVEQAKATFDNGVLEITIPAPAPPRQRIEIQRGRDDAKGEGKSPEVKPAEGKSPESKSDDGKSQAKAQQRPAGS
jgi:HSP20 family protein